MKRGQAALEFLTTYGWAFLVILVMIGALAYFGVINPNRFLPERCQFQQELTCIDFRVVRVSATAATVEFYLQNNLGTGITSMNLSARYVDGTTNQACTAPSGGQVSASQTTNFTCTSVVGNYPSSGDKVKFFVNGSYLPAGGRFIRQMSGEMFAVLQ